MVTRRFGIVTNEFLHINQILVHIVVFDVISGESLCFLLSDPLEYYLAEFKRREIRVGKGGNVEDIQKELDFEYPDSHFFINNKMSQLMDDDRVVDVYEDGDILTGLGVGHDEPRSKDSRPPGDILVTVERRDNKIIFLPIGPQVFKFRASEFFPSIGVFR